VDIKRRDGDDEDDEDEEDEDVGEDDEEEDEEKRAEKEEEAFKLASRRLQELTDVADYLRSNGVALVGPQPSIVWATVSFPRLELPTPDSYSAANESMLDAWALRDLPWTRERDGLDASLLAAGVDDGDEATTFSEFGAAVREEPSTGLLQAFFAVRSYRLPMARMVELLSSLPADESRAFVAGPLLKATNWRLSPEGGISVASRPYCQVCHRVVSVQRCDGCGVAAYCSEKHALEGRHDTSRHEAHCQELCLSRLLPGLVTHTLSLSYTHTHTHIHTHTHTHMRTHTHTHTHTHTYGHTHAHTHAHTHSHAHMSIFR
jgi:hypothetical protein